MESTHGTVVSEAHVFHRPTTSLRELANLIYVANPASSHPHSPHDFRVLFFDLDAGTYRAYPPIRGVTRVTPRQVEALLGPAQEPLDARATLRRTDHADAGDRKDPASQTLMDLNFSPGDIIECVVHAPRTGRDREIKGNPHRRADRPHRQFM